MEKGCNHVDKSACFQPNNSEILKIFCVPMQPRGDIVKYTGLVVFLLYGHLCHTVRQVLQSLTNPFLHVTFLHHRKDLGIFSSTSLAVNPSSEQSSHLPRITQLISDRVGFRP